MVSSHLSKILAFSLLCSVLTVISKNNCPAIEEPGVKYFDVRLPELSVPQSLTTYVCHSVTIPVTLNETYHAVAFEPVIINEDVMHHMILFGCPEKTEATEPHACGPIDNKCRTFLVQWSMGIKGPICSYPETGVRFGSGSLVSLSLQIHWNNQRGDLGLKDSSGVRIYYTSILHKYDLGNVQIGQNDIEILAGQGHVEVRGSCSPACTKHWLPQAIYLTRVHIHLHFIGDELRLTCFYNSRDGSKQRNTTLYWGEGSDGEMCYAFVTYFPKVNNFDQCIQFDRYDICSPNGFTDMGGCVFEGFLRYYQTQLAHQLINDCSSGNDLASNDSTLYVNNICSKNCEASVREMTENPCIQDIRLRKHTIRKYLSLEDSWSKVKVILDAAKRYCTD
ncbi:dopamine beta-hydroxylase-like isoform X2 [Biomphalaria glabrata]|uniref:Dopamine beta-hydroxylase-like isoform X2 n=1 Tax=Biomphalaria glabrata TaxID=6526 RepID=A0A9W2YM57_BIOGL|nr:dopamine beta-hydroxylase-like isoform X2 [Biomphalaria glabrata]